MKFGNIVTLLGFVAIVSIHFAEASKILALMSFNGKSHFRMFEVLLKELASRGHQVYVVGHYPQKNPIDNYTDINVEDSLPVVVDSFTFELIQTFDYISSRKFLWHTLFQMCQKVWEHPNVQKLIKGTEEFDLIITHIVSVDCFGSLSHHFKAPLIGVVTSVALSWANDRVGNPDNPAYIPDYLTPFTHHMNFVQRLSNTIANIVAKVGQYYFAELTVDELSKQYLGQNVPPLSQLKNKTSLILVNSHFSLNGARPTVPAFVEVGGLHIRNDGKLPQDLETFINEAEHGVIYFSLGSMVKFDSFPRDIIQMFIEVFSEIPHRVLWKIQNISGLPDNVRTSQWFPQEEILSHPNVRVFITHGGMFGIQEGVYFGVPMIGIPLFADQKLNINICISKGIALELDINTVTKEEILRSIKTLLHDPNYRTNILHLSQLFRDRPHTPLETAIYWTEYVIRHGGAPHLRSAAMDLHWYQYLLLDVILVLLIIIILSCIVVYYISNLVFIILFDFVRVKLSKKNNSYEKFE